MQSTRLSVLLWWQGRRGGWSGRTIWCCLLGAWLLLVMTQVMVLQTRPYIVHQALARECYPGGDGRGLQLANTCCRMHNYTNQNVTTCVQKIRAAAASNPRYT